MDRGGEHGRAPAAVESLTALRDISMQASLALGDHDSNDNANQ